MTLTQLRCCRLNWQYKGTFFGFFNQISVIRLKHLLPRLKSAVWRNREFWSILHWFVSHYVENGFYFITQGPYPLSSFWGSLSKSLLCLGPNEQFYSFPPFPCSFKLTSLWSREERCFMLSDMVLSFIFVLLIESLWSSLKYLLILVSIFRFLYSNHSCICYLSYMNLFVFCTYCIFLKFTAFDHMYRQTAGLDCCHVEIKKLLKVWNEKSHWLIWLPIGHQIR